MGLIEDLMPSTLSIRMATNGFDNTTINGMRPKEWRAKEADRVLAPRKAELVAALGLDETARHEWPVLLAAVRTLRAAK